MKKHKILVSVLDWGLGHATRCIPLIQLLKEKGQDVIIAGSGDSLKLLREEFPEVDGIELPAYDIHYSKGPSQVWSMLSQAGKISKAIKKENKIIRQLTAERNIDIIISDNRYGCYVAGVKSVMITHQLGLLMPPFLKTLSSIANRWISKQLSHFNECWIPDAEGNNNLSGKLSHGLNVPVRKKYIGALTRLNFDQPVEKEYDAAVVLSGPEPQRTMLEEKIIEQLKQFPGKRFIIIAGKTNESIKPYLLPNIEYVPYLTSRKLNEVIAASEIVISRSGYSTIMDLHRSNKKLILIPTPGQTEQEYLASYMAERNFCVIQKQNGINLENAFKEITQANPFYMELQVGLKEAIEELLN